MFLIRHSDKQEKHRCDEPLDTRMKPLLTILTLAFYFSPDFDESEVLWQNQPSLCALILSTLKVIKIMSL